MPSSRGKALAISIFVFFFSVSGHAMFDCSSLLSWTKFNSRKTVFETHEENFLRRWSEKYELPTRATGLGLRKATRAIYNALGEIPRPLRRKIFLDGDKNLSPAEIAANLEAIGTRPENNYVLQFLLTEHYTVRNDEPYAEMVETMNRLSIANYEALADAAEAREFLQAYSIRQRIEAAVGDRMTREYQMKVGNGLLQLPDGRKYKIIHKGRNKLQVAVPSDRVIGDSENPQMKEVVPGNEVRGTFFPDGRFVADTENDFRRAMVNARNGFTIVTIFPNKDGHYHSLTHADALNHYYPAWLSKYLEERTPQEQEDFLQRVETNPYEAMEVFYHDKMKME